MRMIPMVDKDQFHIKYESCANCYGTFFDAGEYRDLKERTVMERFNQMLRTLRKNLWIHPCAHLQRMTLASDFSTIMD